eukprot:1140501-Amphidinium_carterae.3
MECKSSGQLAWTGQARGSAFHELNTVTLAKMTTDVTNRKFPQLFLRCWPPTPGVLLHVAYQRQHQQFVVRSSSSLITMSASSRDLSCLFCVLAD